MRRVCVLVTSMAASACVADLDRLRAPDAGPAADARPAADAEVAPDVPLTVDAGPCSPVGAPVTLPTFADWIDLAPTGDRVLVGDGVTLTLHALPSGEGVQRFRGRGGYLSADGRAFLGHVADGELVIAREGGVIERASGGRVCAAVVTPDRAAFALVVECFDSPIARALVGRLEVRRFDGALVFDDELVLASSVRVTPRGAPRPRVAYLREPQLSTCSACPTWVAQVTERSLEGDGGSGAPRPLPFRRLVGYTPDGARLLASGATCGCTPERDAELWDLDSGLALGVTPAPWPWAQGGLDVLDQSWPPAAPAIGSGGVAGYPLGVRSLVYAPFGGGEPTLLVSRALPTPTAVVGPRAQDTHVLTSDDLGRPARIGVGGGMLEALSTSAGFGVRSMFLSRARTEVAFTVEYQGQVVVEELAMGRVDGAVRPVFSSSSLIRGLGFVGDRPDFLIDDQGTLRLLRGDGRATELDIASDPDGPVVSDARGCWVAHRRVGPTSEVRVVPVGD